MFIGTSGAHAEFGGHAADRGLEGAELPEKALRGIHHAAARRIDSLPTAGAE
jgi:hypothetical protein